MQIFLRPEDTATARPLLDLPTTAGVDLEPWTGARLSDDQSLLVVLTEQLVQSADRASWTEGSPRTATASTSPEPTEESPSSTSRRGRWSTSSSTARR